MEGLFFANGVTLGPNEDYVLVNETGMGRVHRLWISGDKAGQRDIFVDELPGTPDNIRFDGVDTFWIAMPSLRANIDLLAGLPRLRALLSFLPVSWLEAAAKPASFVVAVDLEGEIVHNLQDQNNVSLHHRRGPAAIRCTLGVCKPSPSAHCPHLKKDLVMKNAEQIAFWNGDVGATGRTTP